jgi:hypothetical protein
MIIYYYPDRGQAGICVRQCVVGTEILCDIHL